MRIATLRDIPALAALERSAATRFPIEDLPVGTREETLSHDNHLAALADNLSWVAERVAGTDGSIQGFLVAAPLDGYLHIQEMSVHPESGRQGIGTALVQVVADTARARGFAGLTLTTFSHILWNRPFYSRRGFRDLEDEELGPGLIARLRAEKSSGLRNRVAMVRKTFVD